jgi:hypothetical protein
MSRTSAIWSIVLMSVMALTIVGLSVVNWNMQNELEACALEVQEANDNCPAFRLNVQLNACRKILDAQMDFLEQER